MPGDVVITIHGFCDPDLLLEGTAIRKEEECKTEITRAQFEKLIDALGPAMERSNRIRIAVQYPEMLLFAQKAHAVQLEQDPKFQERLRYSNLQLLSRTYNSYLAEKAREISDADIEKYYKEHPETFDQVDLLRIFVPKEKKHTDYPSTPAKLAELRAADEAAMKSKADEIQKKAAAGGDFEQLEVEIYKFAGEDPVDAPDVDLGLTTRDEIPEEYRQVFGLKIGQVSEAIATPKGWYICKITSRATIPLEKAKTILERLRLQESINAAKGSVKTQFNDNYFSTPHGMEAAKPSPGAK
jgi:parvulin-like peptidyl-prolyl isomerase